MGEPIFDALRREISETQKRREKLGILKITFVTTLLGFGSIKIDNYIPVYQVLYLAPLIAFFFDLLVMGEHFSIRRMGVFLRLNSQSEKEREYEDFVRNNRDRFFRFGSFGITALSYVAAVMLLKTAKGGIELIEWSWFSIIFVVFIVAVLSGNRRLLKLDRLVESAKSGIAKLGEDARVSIKLCDKSDLKGCVSKISKDGFVVTNSRTKKPTQVTYEQVAQLKGKNFDVKVWFAKAVSSRDAQHNPQPPSTNFAKPNAFDRAVNRAFGLLVRIGIGLKHNYLLEVRGRKSGRLYSTPVNLLDLGGKRYLVAPRGYTQWVKNAVASHEAALVKGFKREKIRLREISDEAKPELLKAYLDRFKLTVQRYFPIPAGSDVEAFKPLAARYPVFELIADK